MTPETVVQIIRQALMTTFWLAAPLLAIGFVAGLVISLVQIVILPSLLSLFSQLFVRCFTMVAVITIASKMSKYAIVQAAYAP